MKELLIKVGIKTDGKPVIIRYGDYTLLKNMLIGDGFHWQQSIEVKLPGEVRFPDGLNEGSGPLVSTDSRNVSLINILPLEQYLECVVGSEMNTNAPQEFLKAHAVISRSWALGKIFGLHKCDKVGKKDTDNTLIGWDDTSQHSGFHVCSDDHCQRYQGLQPIPSASRKAILETAGEILKATDGQLVDARFSKCCGGKTEIFPTCWQSLNEQCLESFIDPWCDISDLSPMVRRTLLNNVLKDYDASTENYGYRWQVVISKEDIEHNLFQKFGRNVGKVLAVVPKHRGLSGRIDLLRVVGSETTLDIGKELWIRRLLSPSHLYSSAFEVTDRGDDIVLTGKGWGHGVGLCQIGASHMAFQGKDYREILSFYYPGSSLSKY